MLILQKEIYLKITNQLPQYLFGYIYIKSVL